MVHQGYIEPHACVARYGADGRIVVWCTTQGPFLVRDACAGILHLDAATIRVMPSEIGGGFGGKIPVYLEPVAIVLSRKSGRPVKIVMDRDDVFRATGPTSGCRIVMKLGAKRTATLVAAQRVDVVRSGRLPRIALRRRRHVRARLLQDPELLRRVVRRRRQQAEGRGVPRARFAHVHVCDRVAHGRNRAPTGHGSDRASAEERGRRGRSRAVRAEVRTDRTDSRCSRPRASTRTGPRRSRPTRDAASRAASGSTPG